MATATHFSSAQLRGELREYADTLVEKLQGDRYEEAVEVINRMVEVRDRSLFSAVGNLTRGLHEAIKSVHVEADLTTDPTQIRSSDISDASDRLSYVISMTEAAAENTLEKVETALPLAEGLGERAGLLRADWAARREGASLEPALASRMEAFIGEVGGGVTELRRHLQDILLEQGYQDLTGQVLARVITLIRSVEHDLVELVKIAGQVEYLTGVVQTAGEAREARVSGKTVTPQGPNIYGRQSEDSVSSQDEVDDLLSQLGF